MVLCFGYQQGQSSPADTKDRQMTSTKELEQLVRVMLATGAKVEVQYDADGYIDTIQIEQLVPRFGRRTIGPYPMSPIAAAEAMRRYLNA